MLFCVSPSAACKDCPVISPVINILELSTWLVVSNCYHMQFSQIYIGKYYHIKSHHWSITFR